MSFSVLGDLNWFAVLVATNQANGQACNDAVLALIGDHFKNEKE